MIMRPRHALRLRVVKVAMNEVLMCKLAIQILKFLNLGGKLPYHQQEMSFLLVVLPFHFSVLFSLTQSQLIL